MHGWDAALEQSDFGHPVGCRSPALLAIAEHAEAAAAHGKKRPVSVLVAAAYGAASLMAGSGWAGPPSHLLGAAGCQRIHCWV